MGIQEYPHSIFIVRKVGGECLLHFSFKEPEADPDILAAFLDAIEQVGSAVLGVAGKFARIDRGKVKLLFEHGNHCFIAAIAPEETTELHEKMCLLIERFEEKYSRHLKAWAGNTEISRKFRLIIISAFSKQALSPDSVPEIIGDDYQSILARYPGVIKGIYKEMLLVASLVDGQRTVRELQELLDFPQEEFDAILKFWITTDYIALKEPKKRKPSKKSSSLSSLPDVITGDFHTRLKELGIRESQLYGLVYTPIFEGDPSRFPILERRFLNLCTGEKSLAVIALMLGMPYFKVLRIATSLTAKGLKLVKKLIKKPSQGI
ncbi:MAG: hypothetical protein ACTSYO_08805 [Candidatus Ranarchaeia archaeon]